VAAPLLATWLFRLSRRLLLLAKWRRPPLLAAASIRQRSGPLGDLLRELFDLRLQLGDPSIFRVHKRERDQLRPNGARSMR